MAEKALEVNELGLPITSAGAGDQLVVLVHGVLDRGRSFAPVMKILESEFEMLCYDRRGYGRALSAPVDVEQHVDDLLAILDGRPPAVLAGHSFGGNVCLGAAAKSPGSVLAIAAYETGMPWAPGWDDTAMTALLTSADPPSAGLRLMFGDRYDLMDDGERARRRPAAEAFVREERSLRATPRPFDLRKVVAPVVYGMGDIDPMPGVVEYLDGTLPQVEFVIAPGAGHHLHRDDPQSFAALVRRAAQLARHTTS